MLKPAGYECLEIARLDCFAVVFLGSSCGIVEDGRNFVVECIIEVTRNVFVFDLLFHCGFDN